ncbi:hypothetical protein T459_17293 [Capsicum annuum]|uniref:IBR domain-containing protein n=1 Tax=Capsicum annuum TaxID=4072 RepID=A0A2G2ZBF5_CAPAN|nr:hypothetical protein T459_17293 [Capsicum annuum]
MSGRNQNLMNKRQRRRCNQNLMNKKDGAGGDNIKEETENNCESVDDDDMQLQEAIFNSVQKLEFDFPMVKDVKKKGIDTSCRLVRINGKIGTASSIHERGKLTDDKRGLIRACPKCWRVFCVKCKVEWHLGLECETYQLKRKLRPLPMVYIMTRKDDDEEGDDQPGNIKVLLLKKLN